MYHLLEIQKWTNDSKEETLWVPPQVHQVHQSFHISSSLQHMSNSKKPISLSQEDESLEKGLLAANERLILN